MIGIIIGVFSFLLIALPGWLASWWTLVSDERIQRWFADQHLPRLAFSPQWITTSVGGGILLVILWAVLSPNRQEKKKNTGLHQPALHPLAAAMDNMRSVLDQGERLLFPYYVEDVPRPTLDDLNAFSASTRVAARNEAWGNLIRLNDLTRLEDHQPDENLRRIKARFLNAGLLTNLTTGEMVVFEGILLRVERLKELIAKIEERDRRLENVESQSSSDRLTGWKLKIDDDPIQGPQKSIYVEIELEDGLIGTRVTNPDHDHQARIEDAWIASVDAQGRKTEAKTIHKYKFKRCEKLPHVMPPSSSFQFRFLYGENAFLSYAQSHPNRAQTEYWVEVKLEDGTVIPSEHRKLPEIEPLPPKKDSFVIVNHFQDLVDKGQGMLERFRNRKTPLPTKAEIDSLSSDFIAASERCATIKERDRFKNTKFESDVKERAYWCTAVVGDQINDCFDLVGTMAVAREILTRLRNEL